MDDPNPRPDAGGSPTKREVTLREDADERVWVEWFVGCGGSFTSVYIEEGGDKDRMLTLDSNELSQLLTALQDVTGPGLYSQNHLVRDLGIERVWVERSAEYLSLNVEQSGEIDRMLILDQGETEELIEAVERAEDELPRTEDAPHA
jgi:hypothetical protein